MRTTVVVVVVVVYYQVFVLTFVAGSAMKMMGDLDLLLHWTMLKLSQLEGQHGVVAAAVGVGGGIDHNVVVVGVVVVVVDDDDVVVVGPSRKAVEAEEGNWIDTNSLHVGHMLVVLLLRVAAAYTSFDCCNNLIHIHLLLFGFGSANLPYQHRLMTS